MVGIQIGCGDRVLPRAPAGYTFDTHSDGVYCTATDGYILAVTAIDRRSEPDFTISSLRLFASAEGTKWRQIVELDRSSCHMPVYASFIDESDDAAIDSHTVGGDFTLLYARRPSTENGFDYSHPDLYRIRIQVSPQGD